MATLFIRLQDALKERGITQKELAEMTGIRTAAISEIANNMRTTINRDHLERIADALGIKDVRQLIELKR